MTPAARAVRAASPFRRLWAIGLVLLAGGPASAQLLPLPQDQGSVGLGLALRRLGVTGRALYVTAHPDDENNPALVTLSRGRGFDTALLTLTRGDGGQNEIGPELFDALGVLRTEELAAVHRYDGAEQYFTRAYEFGYSFSVEETLQKWGRDEILRDVVRVVRSYRPDVILTLPFEAPGGGQHHQAAAQLAREAFRAAADPSLFPEQIGEGLRPWQARKIYQGGVGGGAEESVPGALRVDTGAFDPLLGMSWFQFGMLSRTSHKCQGTDQLVPLGLDPPPRPNPLGTVYRLADSDGPAAAGEADWFDGIDTSLGSLARFAASDTPNAANLRDDLAKLQSLADRAAQSFDPRALERSVAPVAEGLVALRALAERVRGGSMSDASKHEILHRLRRKEKDFEKALALAQSLLVEAVTDDGDVVPGQTFGVTVRVWNRGRSPVALREVGVRAPSGWAVAGGPMAKKTLGRNEFVQARFDVTVGKTPRFSQPYWKRNATVDRYDIEIPQHQTLPWAPPDVTVSAAYEAGGAASSVEVPAILRYPGQWVGGEKQKVVNVVPALSLRLEPEVAIVSSSGAAKPKEYRVAVLNNAKGASEAAVRIEAPKGFAVSPERQTLRFRSEGETLTARFFVSPPARLPPGEHEIKAVARSGAAEHREGYRVIAYDHIEERHLFRPATSRLKTVDVKVDSTSLIGYVAGAGDDVPKAIEGLGFKLTLLSPDDLAYGDLNRFSTIVTGVRAYFARRDLREHHQRLMRYVEEGGHLVVQYNKVDFNDPAPGASPVMPRPADAASPFAPYPGAVTNERVSVEEAPVKILDKAHPVFNLPNRIGASDFEGWVQERGVNFFGAKDARYQELLSSADPWPKNPGEKKGLLTEARVGKGTWTYVGLGLWRQLSAGTTGAYRILANLLSRPRGR